MRACTLITVCTLGMVCIPVFGTPDDLESNLESDLESAVHQGVERLEQLLQAQHQSRRGGRLVQRKLSVDLSLLPGFILQDLAHGRARSSVGAALGYSYGASAPLPTPSADESVCADDGWRCEPGETWRVMAVTERTQHVGADAAVAIDWLVQANAESVHMYAQRFEPALMPSELDAPLLPWALHLHWDMTGARAIDRTGAEHAEVWGSIAPVLRNPEDLYDHFDSMRVQAWMLREHGLLPRSGRAAVTLPPVNARDDRTERVFTDTLWPWEDPNAFTIAERVAGQTRTRAFRPVRTIPSPSALTLRVQWRTPDSDLDQLLIAPPPDDIPGAAGAARRAPQWLPSTVQVWSAGVLQGAISFGGFERVRSNEPWSAPESPPWDRSREFLNTHDHVGLLAHTIACQDRLAPLSRRWRIALDQALQAVDACVESQWTIDELRSIAVDGVGRAVSQLRPDELVDLTYDAVRAGRYAVAMHALDTLRTHPDALAEHRTLSELAIPSLWHWMSEPPLDPSPLSDRRWASDRALRRVLIGPRTDSSTTTAARSLP